MVASSHPGTSSSRQSQPASPSARSSAAVMAGSASTGSRPTTRSADALLGDAEPRLEQLHPRDQAGHGAGHGADGVEARRQRPDAVERDAAPGRLQAGRCRSRRRESGWSHRCRCRRPRPPRPVATATAEPLEEPPGTRRGIERVHRRPVPLVDAGHAEGQLVQVRAADDAGPGFPGAGQAGRVPARRLGPVRHGAATRRRRLPRHVDEVLDGQADPGPRRLVAGDEGGHPLIVSGRPRQPPRLRSWAW